MEEREERWMKERKELRVQIKKLEEMEKKGERKKKERWKRGK